MDEFTERILERARERQKKLLQSNNGEIINPLKESNSATVIESTLKSKICNLGSAISDSVLCTKTTTEFNSIESKSEGNLTNMVKQNSKTRISSNLPGSPQHLHKTLNIQKENFNMEIKLCSTENIRVEVDFQEEDGSEGKENVIVSDHMNTINHGGLRDDAKMRLQRLGKLYAGGDDANISSPIHRTEATFLVAEEFDLVKSDKKEKERGCKGLGGLAALAKDINEWEDALSTPKPHTDRHKNSPPRKSWKPPAPRPPIINQNENTASKVIKAKAPQPPVNENVNKQNELPLINLDQAVLDTLESQGFQRTTSNSRLVYNYKTGISSNKIKVAEINSPKKMSQQINKDCIIEENEPKSQSEKVHNIVPLKYNLKGVIANKAAIFESQSSPLKNGKDPALLSLSERKALFEKNKGEILIPKAPISMAAPVNTEKVACKISNTGSKSGSPVKADKQERKSPSRYIAPRPPIRKLDTSDASAFKVALGEKGGIASKVAALFQNKATISQQQIQNEIKEQRQKEMDVLLHRFQNNKNIVVSQQHSVDSDSESDHDDATETTAMIQSKCAEILKKVKETPSSPPMTPSGNKRRTGSRRCSVEDSPNVAAALDEVKRIKVSPAKPGKLYPCLSDIETATETENEQNTASTSNNSSYEDCFESDPEAAETSFGREILETVCKNQTPQKRPIFDDSTESDMSDILDEMDDYLDEALAYDGSNGPTPPKIKRSVSPDDRATNKSDSFQYKHCTPNKYTSPQGLNLPTPKKFRTPIKELSPNRIDECPAYVVDGDEILPLTHTVSFYRKQQTQGPKTPVRQIIKYPAIHESKEASPPKEDIEVQHKIRTLMDEVTKQQTIIAQTSQALNLCYSTPEFTGSTEQVEAEKVLLLATHRRAAAHREIERLSVLKTLHSDNKFTENIPLEKGKLTISNIVLPLKREYVRALNATGGKGHHVVCLIKCADQVYATQLVSTVATNDRNPNLELPVPGTIQLNNIYSNFTAQFEVYCLQAQNESLPHDVKYHINKKATKNTPKKGKCESRLIRPPKESPGGPQTVRSPTFALMGYVVFSIQAVKRKNWTLNNTPSMSPLEGIVEMRVKCEMALNVEHRGFLTMFEDVSGFGAWHRRWCLLKNHCLSYWKYPDDEKKKAPINNLDLSTCVIQQVGPVRRDICARLNTILVETKRPVQPNDKDSLVMHCNGDTTVMRHLLSADTKEERIEWCTALNKALAARNMLVKPK
ncbi:hypothetical protein RN001_002142 [Aquatica leii]|uniref:PH domain-containing protein n=1 Tax=Aquatica leii TaxID=1421715 RepID=A0AAN7SD39_9COLE|nr:hypothetical protein RN001_002142 [Aquatica leii]